MRIREGCKLESVDDRPLADDSSYVSVNQSDCQTPLTFRPARDSLTADYSNGHNESQAVL